jgi:hypothetical protein
MKRDIDRHAVPEGKLERFMGLVYSLAGPFGVDNVPEVYHYVELLGQAIERHLVESKFAGNSQHHQVGERKKFIAIFKARYLHLTDLEFTRTITGIEGRIINQLIKAISEHEMEVDEYLEWWFEFLAENPKFCPPSIKFAGSNFCIEKFLYENREKIKKTKENKIKQKNALDLIARGRVLIRTFDKNEDIKKKIVEMLQSYGSGSIMINKLQEFIEDMENQARQLSGQTLSEGEDNVTG